MLSLIEKKDVLAVLATGFKKSLIFLLFLLLKFAKISTVFVICPLASIIKDQIFEAACMLGNHFFSSSKTSLDELKVMQLVLGSAEIVRRKAFGNKWRFHFTMI